MELGRDADTGGQVTYVVELARALIEHPAVEKVDLVTRLISDHRANDSYSVPIEEIGIGWPSRTFPPTPPGKRVRTMAVQRGLMFERESSRGRPSISK
jgi:sucrose-phosphate synthase